MRRELHSKRFQTLMQVLDELNGTINGRISIEDDFVAVDKDGELVAIPIEEYCNSLMQSEFNINEISD